MLPGPSTAPLAPSPLARWAVLRSALLTFSAAAVPLAASGCSTTPLIGRPQLVIVPESQEIMLGAEAYEQTLADEPLSQDRQLVEMVNRVGRRIAAVAGKPHYDWEFRVIAQDVMNAFALPGGKVAIYEGIIPVCQDEAGLAVVMSHEVAHALARHGAERLSQQSVATGVGGVLDAISQKNTNEMTAERIMQGYGAASKYGVLLPYSRRHESEADAIGLILMAKAGYDPSAAPEFWERFSRHSDAQPPEWLSTHPADARRAADLRALLPEAMNYYRAAEQQLGLGDALPIPVRRSSSPADDSPPQPVSTASGPSLPPLPSNRPKSSLVSSAHQSVGLAERERDAFRLPVASERPSPQVARPDPRPPQLDPPADDGWHEATGRSQL